MNAKRAKRVRNLNKQFYESRHKFWEQHEPSVLNIPAHVKWKRTEPQFKKIFK